MLCFDSHLCGVEGTASSQKSSGGGGHLIITRKSPISVLLPELKAGHVKVQVLRSIPGKDATVLALQVYGGNTLFPSVIIAAESREGVRAAVQHVLEGWGYTSTDWVLSDISANTSSTSSTHCGQTGNPSTDGASAPALASSSQAICISELGGAAPAAQWVQQSGEEVSADAGYDERMLLDVMQHIRAGSATITIFPSSSGKISAVAERLGVLGELGDLQRRSDASLEEVELLDLDMNAMQLEIVGSGVHTEPVAPAHDHSQPLPLTAAEILEAVRKGRGKSGQAQVGKRSKQPEAKAARCTGGEYVSARAAQPPALAAAAVVADQPLFLPAQPQAHVAPAAPESSVSGGSGSAAQVSAGFTAILGNVHGGSTTFVSHFLVVSKPCH